jgi:hypothetical protein
MVFREDLLKLRRCSSIGDIENILISSVVE